MQKKKKASAKDAALPQKDLRAPVSKSRKPSTLKRQRMDTDTEHDSFSDSEDKKKGGPLLANKHEQSGVDSDDDQRNVHSGTDPCDSDGDSNHISGDEDLDTAATMLLDEVASLITDDWKSQKSKGSACGTVLKDSKVSACDRKQATEIPTWDDVGDTISESVESTTTISGESEFFSDNDGAITRKAQTSAPKSIASLIRSKKGRIKLLDQNPQTRQVVQAAITEVKCYLIFVHGYPELVDKNQLSMRTLLTMAEKHGLHTITEHLQVDEQYASQLGALVDARIPILRHELKDNACANINGYFCLGHKDFAKAKKLMEKVVYAYALKFNTNNNATPIRNKPYQGELLIYLICNQLFLSSKAVGVKFAAHFVEIAKNKAQHPEIPISLLALVATAVYSALLWKSLGSLGKFNFSGNQFSETYNYHVKSLEQLKENAPGKFHRMIADIYEAAHKLSRISAAGDHNELDTLELLDLDDMEEDKD
ncbi:uncharacterized protein BJ212DRAFT_1474855 [Suillus subaureus]|uniref:DUF6532 domain-containing protein n=1 Tax=Suillus subaureus TaxID=48587 RepID=A0A9P7JJ79_9AGAM|nr:uncharacterized protein BJ212DRAFT_1474855 [Suillus subaureus]KAG1825463.1 hypothetical protein BJ212DRAFT_1474855 [Suillus subaureus]